MAETTINSFVVRFVQELPPEPLEGKVPWHGSIRHVQSNTESRFSDFADAIAFMNCYVDITTDQGQVKTTGES